MTDSAELRFRFPFPDEDGIEPGDFDDPFRSVAVNGVSVPTEVDHGKVQFAARGFTVMLPCPQSGETVPGVTICECRGGVGVVQQRRVGAHLVTICECRACGTKYRLPTIHEAEPVIVALAEAGAVEIARRIAQGYSSEAVPGWVRAMAAAEGR